MTPQQREAALRLADWLHASCVVNSEVKETIALLRELLAEPRGEPDDEYRCGGPRCDGNCCQPAQEPVAWCCLTPSGKIAYSDGKPMVMPGPVGNEVHRTPLYAHPQQRKPLTKVQITELAEQCGYDGAVPTVRLAFQGFRLDDFARAIERHYGIEEAP